MLRLPEELTNAILRDIDALFEDNDVPLGPPQSLDNDTSERRGRTRRYLASIDLTNPSRVLTFTRAYSDTSHRIAARRTESGFEPAYLDRWVRTLRAEGFDVDATTFAVTDPNGPKVAFTSEVLAALTDARVIQTTLPGSARPSTPVDGSR